MEPSGERVDVPKVDIKALEKEAQKELPVNGIAEVEHDMEHQYVFGGKKIDGSDTKKVDEGQTNGTPVAPATT